MDEKLNGQDVLLIKEKDSSELLVATNQRDCNPAGIKPDRTDNPYFMRIDRNANGLENYFENFMRQMKDPTRFEFLLVPAKKIQDAFQNLEDAFKNPDKPENREFINMHRVDPNDYLKSGQRQQQSASPTASSYNPIDENRIDWAQFERIGITREALEKTGNLEKLLNRQKTDLMPVHVKLDDISIRTDARLALRETPDGNLSIAVHAIKKEPELDKYYFGVKFTSEDRQNLLKTGNLGRVVEAEYKKDEKTPVLISIDRQTNELVATRADKARIPDNIKGVELDSRQKQDLLQGKAVWVENMTSKKGAPFDAFIQYNADKRSLEFRFDNERNQGQSQKQDTGQKDVPKTFRKVELSEDRRSSLREGKTVYVGDLEDKSGKKYSGYITMNNETGKTDFMFPKDYKDALAAGKVIPDDRHKTQVAVNSEGKTNEATKNVKEPLSKGQSMPADKQAEKQTGKQDEQKKRGRKIS